MDWAFDKKLLAGFGLLFALLVVTPRLPITIRAISTRMPVGSLTRMKCWTL